MQCNRIKDEHQVHRMAAPARIFYFRNRIVVTRCERLWAGKKTLFFAKRKKIAAGDIVCTPVTNGEKVE